MIDTKLNFIGCEIMGRKSYKRVKYRKKINEAEFLYGLVGVVLLMLLFKKPDLFLLGFFTIIIVLPIYKLSKVIQFKNSKITDIDKMDGIEFEKRLEVLFRDLGYRVKRTSSTGDYGADLILKKGIERIVVQAKRYSKPVGIKAIQEALSGKEYYGADKAMVLTNSTYTNAAKNLARRLNIELIAREELIRMLNSTKKEQEGISFRARLITKVRSIFNEY